MNSTPNGPCRRSLDPANSPHPGDWLSPSPAWSPSWLATSSPTSPGLPGDQRAGQTYRRPCPGGRPGPAGDARLRGVDRRQDRRRSRRREPVQKRGRLCPPCRCRPDSGVVGQHRRPGPHDPLGQPPTQRRPAPHRRHPDPSRRPRPDLLPPSPQPAATPTPRPYAASNDASPASSTATSHRPSKPNSALPTGSGLTSEKRICPPSWSTCRPDHSGWARPASTLRKRRSTR